MRRWDRLASGLLAGLALTVALPAAAYTTRVHLMLANRVRDALIEGGSGGPARLRLSDHQAVLGSRDARAIVAHPLAFRAGAVGPDNLVFPASLTDPSHGLHYAPWAQCEALYQDAVTDEERAYAMGCFAHGATDAVGHHLVNTLTGETFTLNPLSAGRAEDFDNVVRHIVAESMIQEAAYRLDPAAFSAEALDHEIPRDFVLRNYFMEGAPVWMLMAGPALEKYDAAVAANPGADLYTLLASSSLGPADHLTLVPMYLRAADAEREGLREWVVAELVRLQDWSDPEGAELLVLPGGDGWLGTGDDETDCAVSCPTLFATYFTYVGLLAPRYDAGGNELPSAFDKISDKLHDDLFAFLPEFARVIADTSAFVNTALTGTDPLMGLHREDVEGLFVPLFAWSDRIATIDYETVARAVTPEWLLDLQDFFNGAGLAIRVSDILRALFDPLVQPVKDSIRAFVIDQAMVYVQQLVDELRLQDSQLRMEFGQRLQDATPPTLQGTVLDHLYDTGLYAHSVNLTIASLANHQLLLAPLDPLATGPASFDASHTPAWTEAGRCAYLREAIFPLGLDVQGALSVRDATGDHRAVIAEDAPVECHDGSLAAFTDRPSSASCGLVGLAELIAAPAHRGSLTRAYPPELAAAPVACRNLVVPGLPEPGGEGGAGGGGAGGAGGGGGAGGESPCAWQADGHCDEPEGTGLCPEGTDPVDCPDGGGGSAAGGAGGGGGGPAGHHPGGGAPDEVVLQETGCGCATGGGRLELGGLGLLGLALSAGRRRRRSVRGATRWLTRIAPVLLACWGVLACAEPEPLLPVDDGGNQHVAPGGTGGSAAGGSGGETGGGAGGEPACAYEDDGRCDEPGGTGLCDEGTDPADCAGQGGAGGGGAGGAAAGGAGGLGGAGGGGGAGGLGGGGSGGEDLSGRLLDALGQSRWHGVHPRAGRERAWELQFDAPRQAWVEIRNPWGPGRWREHRVFTAGADGRSVDSRVTSPNDWPPNPENGRADHWELELIDSAPRQLAVTRDGVTEWFEEGAWPAPKDGLTAEVRTFPSGGAVDLAFCASGGALVRPVIFDFARGLGPNPPMESDAVAGAWLLSWRDDTGGNRFGVTDVDGFDFAYLGGTELSDQYNFAVRYTGTIQHPGGRLAFREQDDSIEDGLWVFVGPAVGSTDEDDVLLEVHGFFWADLTPDEPELWLDAGDVPVEIIIVRCAVDISPIDVELALDAHPWNLVGYGPTTPELSSALFPPALYP